MLESLVLPHIHTALSALFEDIEAHQVVVSILRGSLVLRDLRFKPEALAPLSLPIEVTYGHVETLEIKDNIWGKTWVLRVCVCPHLSQYPLLLPSNRETSYFSAVSIQLNLLRLFTEPIQLCAENILVIATTQPPSTWSVEREEAVRDQQRNLTLLTDECLTYAREESGLPSVLQRAAYAVIQRIRLSFKGLELRLEDTETAPNQPFALGLRASRLYNIHCDSKWRSYDMEATAVAASTAGFSRGTPEGHSQTPKSSSQWWFGWLTGLGRRQEKELSHSGSTIPECFYLKTILEDAAIYLDPLTDDNLQSPWLPYPALYRERIRSNLGKLLAAKSFSLNAVEADFPKFLGTPKRGEGLGRAAPALLERLKHILYGRKRRVQSPAELHEVPSRDKVQMESKTARASWRGQVFLAKQVVGIHDTQGFSDHNRATEESSVGQSGPSIEKNFNAEVVGGLMKFSDLYHSRDLWQLAKASAANHLYILKPARVEIRARCVQRPMAPFPNSGELFHRPSPMLTFGEVSAERSPERAGDSEKYNGAPMAATACEESLPALSIIVMFREVLLQFTALQIASLCRWLHFGVILYQEVVSGVYAECLDLTPSREELQRYRIAWGRHLLAHAVAATGGATVMGRQTKDATEIEQLRAVDASSSNEDQIDMEAVEDIIRAFESKYWPTVIIPIRQEVLQKLKERARLIQSGGGATKLDFSPPQHSGSSVFGGPSRLQTLREGDTIEGGRERPGEKKHSFEHNAEADSARMLLAKVAQELDTEISAASGMDLQLLKCIEQMKPQRISKSFHFSVKFEGLEATLSPLYEAPECIRMTLIELYSHIEFYYDLRTSLAAAFEGVSIVDNLLPSLAHRHVLTSQPYSEPNDLFKESSARLSSWKNRKSRHTADHLVLSTVHSQRSFKTSEGTPSQSPLQDDEDPCTSDWNYDCLWRNASCPFDTLKDIVLRTKEKTGPSQNSRAGGWIRFEKVYVPLEGLPDVVFHMQTHGSLLCTVTPAAVAFLAQTLQEPVQLVERTRILEAANREVQEVIHRNEVFVAKVLMGEIDHRSIDICIDIPVPHQLLLPFNHKDFTSRGVLLQSGTVFFDTRLQYPRIHPSSFSVGDSSKAYDRYLAKITGACVQRVPSCLTLKCAITGAQQIPCFGPSRTHCTAAAVTDADSSAPINGHNICVGSSRRRKSQKPSDPTHSSSSRCAATDEYGEKAPDRGLQESEPTDEYVNGKVHEAADKVKQKFILWPVGIVGCIDVCHFSGPQNLPTFHILIQDQDFRWVLPP